MSSRRSRSGGHRDDVRHQARVEVGAEGALRDRGLEVHVGRRDHAHVDVARLIGADRAHLADRERAQQLGLHGDADLADLVEEQRAAIGAAEQPLARVGAREGAAHVAEQLALGEVLRQRGAVDRHERALRPPTSWIAWATSSLPTPVSPSISVGALIGADRIARRTRASAWPWPTSAAARRRIGPQHQLARGRIEELEQDQARADADHVAVAQLCAASVRLPLTKVPLRLSRSRSRNVRPSSIGSTSRVAARDARVAQRQGRARARVASDHERLAGQRARVADVRGVGL